MPNDVRRALHLLFVAVALMYGVAAGFTGYAWMHLRETEGALCSFRHDLELRVKAGERFLANPDSLPQFNSPEVIAQTRVTVNNQRRTIQSLENLHC